MKKELFRYIISGILVLTAGIVYIINFPGQGEQVAYVAGELPGTESEKTELLKTEAPKTELPGAEASKTDSLKDESSLAEAENPYAEAEKGGEITVSESVRVNINTAGPEELMKLNGIGQSRANSIISYREENGDFKAAEDIMKVPGIKLGIYRKISEYITVD